MKQHVDAVVPGTDSDHSIRPVARTFAREISIEEIKLVSGGYDVIGQTGCQVFTATNGDQDRQF